MKLNNKVINNLMTKILKVDSNAEAIDFHDLNDEIVYIVADWNNSSLDKINKVIFNLYQRGYDIEDSWEESWVRCECGKQLSYDSNYVRGNVKGMIGDGFCLCSECMQESLQDVIEHYSNNYDFDELSDIETKGLLIKDEQFIELNFNDCEALFELFSFERSANKTQEIYNYFDKKDMYCLLYGGYDAKKTECYHSFSILVRNKEL